MADQHDVDIRPSADAVDATIRSTAGRKRDAQVQGGLPAGQPRVQLAAPPGVVDLEERLERRLVGAAFQVADGHLVHTVDHLDREPVRGGHRGGGLLRPDRPGGVHGADRVVGQPAGQPSAWSRPSSSSGAPGGRLSRMWATFAAVRPCRASTSLTSALPAAQAGEPALGGRERRGVGAVLGNGRRTDAGGRAVPAPGPGVGTEEAHPVAAPVQRRHRLAHRGLGDVSGAVEVEPVLGVPVLDRTRLDAREVDAAHGQLGQQPEQRSGAVLGGGGQRRAVVAGRRGWRAGRGEEHEAGHGPGVVRDVVGDDLQAELVGRQRRADGGVDLPAGHLRGRLAGGRADQDVGVRQVPGDPVAGLGDAVVVRRDGPDLLGGRARTDHGGEPDGEHHLFDDHQTADRRAGRRAPVARRPRRCSRSARSPRRPARSGWRRGRPGCRRTAPVPRPGLRKRQQGLLGEGRVRAEERQSGHGRRA